jgi:hypothetical protein
MPPTPWPVDAVRTYLLADSGFATLIDSRAGSRLAGDMTKPFLQIRVIGGFTMARFATSPLLQLDPWVPKAWPGDPERVAWDIAVAAGELLDVARNVVFEDMTWKSRWLDGPQSHVDVSRGEASPLYSAPIRVEMRTHTR